MININVVYEKVRAIIAKSQGTGYLKAADFNRFINMASLELYNELFAEFQRNQIITDSLRPFITLKRVFVNEYGQLPFFADYRYLIAIRSFAPLSFEEAMDACKDGATTPDYNAIEQIEVEGIDNSQLGVRLSSPNFKPTLEMPIYTIYQNYFQFYPRNISTVMVDYLRSAQEGLWVGVIGANGLPTYDPINSINLDWSEVVENLLIEKVAKFFGVEVRDMELYSAAKDLQQ